LLAVILYQLNKPLKIILFVLIFVNRHKIFFHSFLGFLRHCAIFLKFFRLQK